MDIFIHHAKKVQKKRVTHTYERYIFFVLFFFPQNMFGCLSLDFYVAI